jgi:endonuclease/exonuclease/phosphatase family metal-dependent hydrolase
MVDDIAAAGGPRYRVFQRENALIQDTLPFGGLRIADRGAILLHPRFNATQATSLTFTTLQKASVSLPGSGGVVVRGALHVEVALQGGTLDLFNTHLQSGADATDVRQAQSAELASWIHGASAPGATVVLTSDLNDVPGSPPYQTLTAGLTDTYAVAGVAPGFTAYQPPALTNTTDQATMRVDFVMVRAGSVEDSRLIFNAHVAPCNLWPSDHFGVVSRFKTVASQ